MVEKVAINLIDARIPDNEGNQPIDESIQAEGDNAYFATVPVKAMVANIRKHGIPATLSFSAGTFVCNYIMYEVLHNIANQHDGVRAGFIHVPFLPEQAVGRADGTASMPLETIAKGLEYAIAAIVEMKEEPNETMGTLMSGD
ncbi:hypothetical protein B9T62_36590 [Paenibacillus donghaensis]|uniref:Pyroglutamyl-peptidase I n=1 Tax=Paenibacillus donghaensis TaxID=414771 RepID=A0A2Z2KIM4_9BACL|nr:hypothetical protein [Paenibacillus donghaensis]ASA25767.1 hypothetical protein B9T62_36590 [Paenibacillus donghaensis]